jgi:hypothetical protein
MVNMTGQRVIPVLIFLCGLFAFMYKRNVEWQGDDDYLLFCASAVYSNLQLIPDEFSSTGLVRFGQRTIKPFLYAPHNIMPALAYGLFYRILDWCGVPFSTATIHLPIALLSALSCSLFFLLLVRTGLATFIAMMGALLFLLSPLFAMASRSATTSWGPSVLLSQLLALLALHHLSDRKFSKILAGLALLNVVLTDNLFFLTLPMLAAVYALRDAPIGSTLSSPKNLPRSLWQNTQPLRAKTIFLPATLMAAWWIVSTFYALIADRVGIWHPITPLCRLTPHTHRDFGTPGLFTPLVLPDYMALLGGEAFLYVFLAAIVLYFMVVRKPIKGVAWSYAVIGGLAYAALFYAVTSHSWERKNLYQIYVLMPFMLLFLLICQTLIREYPRYRFVMYGILCLLVVSAGAGHLSYVYRARLSLSKTAYADWIHGANCPNDGSKALGYLVRRTLEAKLARDPAQPVRLSVYNGANYLHVTSLAVFSGLMDNGVYFEKKYGIKPPVTVEKLKEFQPRGLRFGAILDLRRSDNDSGESKYSVTLDGELIAALVVLPAIADEALPRPGTYDLHFLEEKFDAAYRSLEDYYPAPYWQPGK